MAIKRNQKGGTSFQVPEETPIKHTAGGEMPDVSTEHHVDRKELESMGDFEEESFSLLDQVRGQVKDYLPIALATVGVGIGALLIYRFVSQRLAGGEQEFSEEEGDFIADEGKRAQQVANVQPSRLMGA